MRVLLAILMAAGAAAFGQTFYSPEPNRTYCRVTGATNATPISMTIAEASRCGVTTSGLVILVMHVGGNRTANMNPGGTATTYHHLARKTSGLVVNGDGSATFNLLDMNDQPVAGSGAYTANTGYVHRAVASTFRSPPNLMLDGPSGSLTTAFSARAVPGNPFWDSVLGQSTLREARGDGWGQGLHGAEVLRETASTALKCYVSGGTATTACTLAKADVLTYVDQLFVGGALNKLVGAGGQGNSSGGDYIIQTAVYFSQIVSLLRGVGLLNSTELAAINNALWQGIGWDGGGADFTGANVPHNTFKFGYTVDNLPDSSGGTVTYTANTKTLTFSQAVSTIPGGISPGDLVFAPHPWDDGYSWPFKIVSCTGNTCTTAAEQNKNFSNARFAISGPWDSSKAGWFNMQCASTFAVLCNKSSNDYGAGDFPTAGNPKSFGVYWADYWHNLVMGRLLGIYIAGFQSCSSGDSRGCHKAQQASFTLHDFVLPRYVMYNQLGNGPMTVSYNSWRGSNALIEWAVASKYGLNPSVNFLSQAFVDETMKYSPAMWGRNYGWIPYAEGAVYPDTQAYPSYPLLNTLLNPSPTLKAHFYWWLNYRGLPSGASIYNNFSAIAYEPAATQTQPPTSYMGTSSLTAECVSVHGADRCLEDWGGNIVTSRSSWTTDRMVWTATYHPYCQDHCQQGPAQVNIAYGKTNNNGFVLMGGGAGPLTEHSTALHRAAPLVGAATNLYEYGSTKAPVGVGRESFIWGKGSDTVMTSKSDFGVFYRPAANASYVRRYATHFKPNPAGEYVVELVGVSTTAPILIRGQHFMPQHGCSTCTAADLAGKTFQNLQPSIPGGVVSKLLSFSGTHLLSTESGNGTNLTYTGSVGSGRVQVCSSANGTTCDATNTGLEYAIVTRLTDGSSTLPTIASSVSGSLRVVEIQDAAYPSTGVYAPLSGTVTSGAFSTSHAGTGRYALTGLAAGTYNVLRGGAAVSGSPFTVAPSEQAIIFEAASGAFSFSQGNTYYASTTGNAGNSGTLASPWTLAHALSSANSTLQPGDTVYVRGGTYTGRYVSTKAGTAGNVITYRPYQAAGEAPEAVIIDRQILTDGQNAALEIASTGGYVRFIGFRVTNSNTDRRSASNASNPTDMRPAGVESFAPGVEIINFTIDNNGTGLAAWSTGATADSSLFYGNVLLGNGWQSADGAQRGHGHGCYMQNQATGTKTLRHNISLWNFNHGCQIYGSGDTGVYIKSFDVDQNTFFENGEPSLQGYDRQLLVGAGQFCSANTVRDNNAWLPVGSSAQTLNLGYLATLFCTTFTATNNYLIGGEMRIAKQRAAGANSVFTGNTVYAQVGWEDQAGDGGFSTGWGATIPGGSGTTVSGNTQLSATPGANRIVVQANAYEANRGNVIVYNWTGATSAAVDVSGFLTPGTAYKVLDTQNWFGSPVATGIYAGGSISIPLTGTTTSPLIGANAGTDFNQPTHTPSQFNAFVVMQDFNPPAAGGQRTTVTGRAASGAVLR